MQNLKTLVLKVDGAILISEIKEVESYEIGEPDCVLVNPCQMAINTDTSEVKMWKWPVFTDQREIRIHSDSILTIVEPKTEQIELYLKTIK